MSFNTAIFTNDGLLLLGALSSSKSLRIKNIYVSELESSESTINDSPATWATRTAVTMAKLTAVLESAAPTTSVLQQARLVVKMDLKPAQTTTVTAKTIIITACGVESGVETDEITFCGISDPNGIEVIKNASNISISSHVSIYFKFNNESTIYFESEIAPDYVVSSDLDRFLTCHVIGNSSAGEAQSVLGSKSFEDNTEFNSNVTVNLTTDNHIALNDITHNTNNYISIPDEHGFKFDVVSDSTSSGDIFNICDDGTSNLKLSREANGNYCLNCNCSIKPTTSSSKSLGNDTLKWAGLYTDTLDATPDEVILHDIFLPSTTNSIDLGSYTKRFANIFTSNLNASNTIRLYGGSNYFTLSQDGYSNLKISGFTSGHDMYLDYIGSSSVNPRASLYCGTIYANLPTPSYYATSAHPTLPTYMPDSTAETAEFTIPSNAIVIAIPCWSTTQTTLASRRFSVGESIAVNYPTATPPYTHNGTAESDPEQGAWFIAEYAYNTLNSRFMYQPVSTQNTSGGLFYSYLPAGSYRTLSCIQDSPIVSYSNYHQYGCAMMLQKI
jgi:hypothetical protein